MRTLYFLILTMMIGYLFAEENFLVYDLNTQQWLCEQGPHCDQRIPPNSSFKIPLSLMGFDCGVLTDETAPEWPYQEGYTDFLPIWKMPMTPGLWMRHSCVWFSQVLTSTMGIEQFQAYADLFNYGNKDLSGGLTNAWLMSSLKISPREQIFFLEKVLRGTLPVSAHAISMTKNITFLDVLNGWKLHGKTGSGRLIHPDGTIDKELGSGWFIGWLEKDNRTIAFVLNLRDEVKTEGFAGIRAKARALQLLQPFTQ